MKKLKIIFTLIIISILIYINTTIAAFWSKIHVNSLIGFQKVVETINPDIWHNIFIPIIRLELYILFIILCLTFFILKGLIKLLSS